MFLLDILDNLRFLRILWISKFPIGGSLGGVQSYFFWIILMWWCYSVVNVTTHRNKLVLIVAVLFFYFLLIWIQFTGSVLHSKFRKFHLRWTPCPLTRFCILINTMMIYSNTGTLMMRDVLWLETKSSKLLIAWYRHVILPADLAKLVPRTHLMSETEWRNLGVQQSPGWIHYMVHFTKMIHILNLLTMFIFSQVHNPGTVY